MSTTRRSMVRNRVEAVLRAGMPDLGERVFRARTWPLQETGHPAALVYGYDEDKTRTNMSRGEASYDVTCRMVVELRALGRSRDGELVEAELEVLADGVCRAVMTAPELLLSAAGGGLDVSIGAARTTLKISTEGDLAAGSAVIAFEMAWQEQFGLPDPPDLCDEFAVAFEPAPVPSP